MHHLMKAHTNERWVHWANLSSAQWCSWTCLVLNVKWRIHLLYPFGFGFPGWFKHTLVSGYAWSLLLMFQSSQRKTHSIIKRFTSMSTLMWSSIQDHTWKSAMSRQSYQTENYSKHRQMCLIIRVDHSHLLLLVSFQSQILSWIELATEWVE